MHIWLVFIWDTIEISPSMSPILASHVTLSSMDSLPCYRASSPPPFYSARVSDGEEVLAATRVYRTPSGSFTARCHCSDITVTLEEQNEDVETPVYHQQGRVFGTIAHKSTENLLQVILKVPFSAAFHSGRELISIP